MMDSSHLSYDLEELSSYGFSHVMSLGTNQDPTAIIQHHEYNI